ncbi:hypothetical protein MSG28_009322 [Choristoneura fumiferana]|uniref:Uncharacterized protein n=1 Tax=Choristoneura fumiferana TaxID=7141 RepID=A0ACC0KXM6_CHOFU|nr:hypothetical protein MSG28_009322 [Choristoneura fumiferana]
MTTEDQTGVHVGVKNGGYGNIVEMQHGVHRKQHVRQREGGVRCELHLRPELRVRRWPGFRDRRRIDRTLIDAVHCAPETRAAHCLPDSARNDNRERLPRRYTLKTYLRHSGHE